MGTAEKLLCDSVFMSTFIEGSLIALYNYLGGGCSKVGVSLFSMYQRNDIRLCQLRVRLHIRNFFSQKGLLSSETECPGKW